MKKLFSFLLILVILLSLIPKNLDASESGYFIVTAYYSPLPGQKHYITGDFESEKRLNGNGIAGASGKKVFSGMLAAPGKYSFGTKIKLKGLGVGSVDDRGGAIVPAGKRGYSHDRIDVWVGYGDEGLRRAMYWGKRKIAGSIVSSSTPTTLDYNSIPGPSWAVPKTTTLYGKTVQVEQNDSSNVNNIFSQSIGKGSNSDLIKKLQKALQEIGYYNSKVFSGEYDRDTIDAVYNFQIHNNIIKSESTPGAGSFGPKTRKKFQEIFKLYQEEEKIKNDFLILYRRLEVDSLNQANGEISLIGKPKYGDISPQVRMLQKSLASIGVFKHKDTAIFGPKTENSLIDLQLENNLIKSAQSLGAGSFGPSTRKVLGELISKEILYNKIVESKLLEKYNKYIDISPEIVDIDLSLENIAISI